MTILARLSVAGPLPAIVSVTQAILVTALLSSSTAAAASLDLDCLDLGKKVAAAVPTDDVPDESVDEPDKHLTSCKRLPDDPAKAILVIRNQYHSNRLMIVEVATGHIVSSGNISGDIGLGTDLPFMIDTARYWVRPGTRAFAIVGDVARSHKYSEETMRELNLYEQRGHQIVPLLKDFAIEDNNDGVSNCVDPDSTDNPCTGDVSWFKRSLTMGRASSNGYSDIVVTELSKHCDGVSDIAACKAQVTWRHEKNNIYTLKYDGKSYIEVDENEASRKVRILTIGEVNHCRLLDNVHMSPPLSVSPDQGQDIFTREAKYAAVNMGADTVVPLSSAGGNQIFGVYRCVDKNEAGKDVRVLTESEILRCRLLDNVSVDVLPGEGRDAAIRRAQNVATDIGADTIAPLGPLSSIGEHDRVVSFYRCLEHP